MYNEHNTLIVLFVHVKFPMKDCQNGLKIHSDVPLQKLMLFNMKVLIELRTNYSEASPYGVVSLIWADILYSTQPRSIVEPNNCTRWLQVHDQCMHGCNSYLLICTRLHCYSY